MTQVPAPQALCLSSSLDETLYPPRVRVWPVFSVLPTSSCYKYCSWEVAWSDSAVRLKFIHRSKINGMKSDRLKRNYHYSNLAAFLVKTVLRSALMRGLVPWKVYRKELVAGTCPANSSNEAFWGTSCGDLCPKNSNWFEIMGLVAGTIKLVPGT